MSKNKQQPTKGRPPGSPNVKTVVIVPASRCTQCDSTDSKVIGHLPDQFTEGLDQEEKPYNVIARRRVECLKCGQVRIEKSFENRRDQE